MSAEFLDAICRFDGSCWFRLAIVNDYFYAVMGIIVIEELCTATLVFKQLVKLVNLLTDFHPSRR